jgi:hypothetical protein
VPTPLPPPVSSLEARLGVPAGSLVEEDLARAEAALEDATTLALSEVSDAKAAEWGLNAPRVVALVVLKAARREYENPRGISQEAQGDHSVSISESSGVYLTSRELAQIRRAAAGRPGGYFVGSVRITSAYDSPEGV